MRKFSYIDNEYFDGLKLRVGLILAIVVLIFISLSIKLVRLSIESDSSDFSARPFKPNPAILNFSRKNIVDRNGILLATNLKTASVFAEPHNIINAENSTKELIKIFPDLNYDKTLKKLKSDRKFVWVKRKIHPKEQKAVNLIGEPGLLFKEEEKRVYPHSNLLSHILGFTNIDGKGISGVELSFNDFLSNKKQNENNELTLSIDIRLQDILYNELKKEFEEHSAIGASGVILDVDNGEILAMVSLPDFNPNEIANIENDALFNRVTKGVYEMGSTFKTFTLANALEDDLVKEEDIFDTRRPIRVKGGFTITDYKPKNRPLSVKEIFQYSSNIGTVKISQLIGQERQKDFFSMLGLLGSLEVKIPEKGQPIYPKRWNKVEMMTASYGHGIAVTPLHTARAMSAIVNGGLFRYTTIIKGHGDDLGSRVISKNTSRRMQKLLQLVVEDGTGRKAKSEGYLVGGKTGTAEKVSIKGGYDEDKLVSSFAGVFPTDKPKYVIVTLLDEPKGTEASYGYATAGYTAAPVVKNVVSQIAPIINMKPINH